MTLNPLRYCSLAANLVISWPNDGLGSLADGLLVGGNAVEYPFEGECHTDGKEEIFFFVLFCFVLFCFVFYFFQV